MHLKALMVMMMRMRRRRRRRRARNACYYSSQIFCSGYGANSPRPRSCRVLVCRFLACSATQRHIQMVVFDSVAVMLLFPFPVQEFISSIDWSPKSPIRPIIASSYCYDVFIVRSAVSTTEPNLSYIANIEPIRCCC